MPPFIDEGLLPYATEVQAKYLNAINEYGSGGKAAKALGVDKSTINYAVQALRRSAAARGYAPEHDMTRPVPEGFKLARHAQYYDSDGKPRGKWVIATPDAQAREAAMKAAFGAMASELPRVAPIDAPSAVNDDLANLYTYSDFHLGMLSNEEESGADWDIKIAERTMMSSFAMMIEQSPAAHTAVVNIQGDMLHSDGLLPVTPAHRHVLDQDGRFSRIVATAIRSIRQLVRMALERHQEVHLVIAEGNHDEASSVWLRLMFAALYEDEPRVSVNASELPFYVFEWGETMLGFHHGHKVKNEQLPLLFAAQFPEVWGRTKRRAVHCGHRHHCDEKEYNGVTVVQHATIAARDAYAARGGWIADRAVQSITYSKRFGQVGRVFVTPEMLAA